jgi:8-oxo-dGTP pyrophosphatase MutT (NUDIX family)
MHWIRRHILIELTLHTQRRHSQLRPSDVESNLFQYHLNGLMNENFVAKAAPYYHLTTKGRQYISTLSLKLRQSRKQPQILVALVARNSTGQYLFSRWHRQPNTGLLSFPHGMMHLDVSLTDMAAAELAEKAGLRAALTYRGDVYVRAYRGDTLDRHQLVHVFEAGPAAPIPHPPLHPEASEPCWADLASLGPTDFVPGFYELARHLDEHPTGPIFADFTVNL